MRPDSCIQASSRYSWHSKNSPLLNSSMPWRTRSGSSWGGFPDVPPARFSSAAAAAPAAAPSAPGHTGVHHGVGRQGRSPRGYGGEVGDHTPRLRRAALGTIRRLISITHGAHEVEVLLARGALVLVEGHLYPTSRSTELTPPTLYRPSRPEGNQTRGPISCPALSSVKRHESTAKSGGRSDKLPASREAGARLSGVMGKGKGEAWAPTALFISHIAHLSRLRVAQALTPHAIHSAAIVGVTPRPCIQINDNR